MTAENTGTRDRMAIAALSLAVLMPSLDTSLANASLPSLAEAFGASFQQAQWIVLANLVAITSLTVGAGRVGDLLGRRRVLLVAVALFTVMTVLCAAAPGLWPLVAARAVLGVAAAAITALAVALASDIARDGRAGRVMGRLAAMSAIGTTIGPAVGSLLLRLHPAAVFLVNLPLGMLVFELARRSVPAATRPSDGRGSLDGAGTFLLAAALAAYALSMTLGRGRWSALNAAWLGAAILCAAVLVVVEAHASAPVVPLEVLRDRALGVNLMAAAAVSTVVMATLIVGPYYVSRGLGIGGVRAGVILSLGPAAAAVSAAVAGRFVERAGTGRTGAIALVAMAFGATALAILPLSLGVGAYVGSLVTITAGYAVFQTANNTAVMARVGDERRGLVAGLLALSRNFGLITGASAMGAVFLHATGAPSLETAEPSAVGAGMRVTLAVCAVLTTFVLAIVSITRTSFVHSATPHNPRRK